MIPNSFLTAWSVEHPWPEIDQVEQDLLLTQAMCEIAADDTLGSELAIRGGTALHKLHLARPYRYSEDLDYVRVVEGPIGKTMRRLTNLGTNLGFEVRTQMAMYPKVFWRYISASGTKRKIKIEINTYERNLASSLTTINVAVSSDWCQYNQGIVTFPAVELAASKIRALYQRSKGRDLFDLWLALTVLELNPHEIARAFSAYRPDGLKADDIARNLEAKLDDAGFCSDMRALVSADVPDYNPQDAGRMLMDCLLPLID